jgi:hypothetical protein
MVKIKYESLSFDHIVEFSKDNTVFACARQSDDRHLRIFLVNKDTGNVYTRNGRADSWEELTGANKQDILNRIEAARSTNIAVYRVNGSHN